jgi:hypothetical protein
MRLSYTNDLVRLAASAMIAKQIACVRQAAIELNITVIVL